MYKKLLPFILLLLAFHARAQFVNKSFKHGGLTRQYRLYVPPVYQAGTPVPLVVCLHGLGDNMTNFSLIGMNKVADTANFIVVFPQAIVDGLTGSSAWNSGAGYSGYFPNASVNDVDFIKCLIDTLSAHYSIDQSKVFATGFSMGGFMSNRLACQLNNRIAAIASVAGTIGSGYSCVPGKMISVCHFHGTADGTVAYDGGPYGIGARSLLNFWINNNNCDTSAQKTLLPNSKNDGYTVEHYVYANADSGILVEHFKVNNANHVWLTSANDISYTTEIWNFFNRIMRSGVHIGNKEVMMKKEFLVAESETSGIFNIQNPMLKKCSLSVMDTKGNVLLNDVMNSSSYSLDLTRFASGIYLLRLQSGETTEVKKLLIQK